MAIKALSNFSLPDLVAYGRERIVTRRILLLVVFIMGLTFIAEQPRTITDIAIRSLLVAVLIVQFRIWDDLADRDFDRRHHPERVLARIDCISPFWFLLGALGALAIVLLFVYQATAFQFGCYVMLLTLFALLYVGTRRIPSRHRFWRVQSVLLKYPAFVFLAVKSPSSAWMPVAAATAYLMLSAFEWYDDDLQQSSHFPSRAIVLLYTLLLLSISLQLGHD
jgi:hypothetical protein